MTLVDGYQQVIDQYLLLREQWGVLFDIFIVVLVAALDLITLIVAWLCLRLIGAVESNALARAARADNHLDATTVDAIAKLVRSAVLVTTALALLDQFGMPPSSLLALSGIGGIAVGFAAREVLANLFDGVTLYLNRPFAVADWNRSPERDIERVVEAIGWRATTVVALTSGRCMYPMPCSPMWRWRTRRV